MKPAQLDAILTLSTPSVHASGTRCAVAATRPDFRADAPVGQLWEVQLDGSRKPRRLTRGFRDTAPRYSPDGAWLAFLRAAPEGRAQLAIVESAGGEPRVITNRLLGIEQFVWSPDSRRIAFTSREPEQGRYGSIEGVGPRAEDPRLVTRLNYRVNGPGYTADQRVQLFVLSVPDADEEPLVAARGRVKADEDEAPSGLPEARQLTSGAVDYVLPSFSADGRSIYTVSAFAPDAIDTLTTRVVRTPADGGESIAVDLAAPEAAHVESVAEAPDGSGLFVLASQLGESGTDFVGWGTRLFWHSFDDGSTAQISVADDDLGEAPGALRVDADGRALVLARRRGAVALVAYVRSGGREVLADGAFVVTGVDSAGDAVVVSVADATSPGELAVARATGLGRLTDFGARLGEVAEPLVPREFVGQSADGTPVHGWVVLPAEEGPHPVLLNIHGGPFAQYTGAWFDEAQVYARAGYAVVMCNPRGSAGYGEDHARAIKGRMGTVDFEDVLGFLDSVLDALPGLDRERLGVMGGSYGGYLTAWTIAHDHRFRAAIVERGFLDPASFVGSADIGWFFPGEYTGWSADEMRAQSPMACVDDVATPTLVIHSEEDWRCPIEQAQRFYTALRLRGIDTELLVFPGENHELSRSGTPHHRRQRFEHILRWWARHLPTSANPGEDMTEG
ncbi:S9 family peptidase [Sinomonas sp. ASV322]|uniref:S9 family peptidase n=1 Tax=Sinomonas sp. ASV322 TaxID=3041920 RepID=UPI0027DC42EF|nr:S9 family peptidase [Sinomonas sp. ASV322]MDQ4501049.1 S9 family peptidase [Sinomonas sp. ASV322]